MLVDNWMNWARARLKYLEPQPLQAETGNDTDLQE